MGGWFSRVTWLQNDTDEKLEIRECTFTDQKGEFVEPIVIQPGKYKKISATRFSEHGEVGGCSRNIKVFREAGTCAKNLPVHRFIATEQFTFTINDGGQLEVKEITTQGFIASICRLGLVASFRRPPEPRKLNETGRPAMMSV